MTNKFRGARHEMLIIISGQHRIHNNMGGELGLSRLPRPPARTWPYGLLRCYHDWEI